jgi:hypothetical protein
MKIVLWIVLFTTVSAQAQLIKNPLKKADSLKKVVLKPVQTGGANLSTEEIGKGL